jgi:hypothetical protein
MMRKSLPELKKFAPYLGTYSATVMARDAKTRSNDLLSWAASLLQ